MVNDKNESIAADQIEPVKERRNKAPTGNGAAKQTSDRAFPSKPDCQLGVAYMSRSPYQLLPKTGWYLFQLQLPLENQSGSHTRNPVLAMFGQHIPVVIGETALHAGSVQHCAIDPIFHFLKRLDVALTVASRWLGGTQLDDRTMLSYGDVLAMKLAYICGPQVDCELLTARVVKIL